MREGNTIFKSVCPIAMVFLRESENGRKGARKKGKVSSRATRWGLACAGGGGRNADGGENPELFPAQLLLWSPWGPKFFLTQ